MAIELSYINTKHPDFHDASLVGTLIKNVEQEARLNVPRKSKEQTVSVSVTPNFSLTTGMIQEQLEKENKVGYPNQVN